MSITCEGTSTISHPDNRRDPDLDMACNTMLADFQSQELNNLHNNMSTMLKEKYSCNNTTKEEKQNGEDSNMDDADDGNICVDSRSSSPNAYTNGHTDKVSDKSAVTPPTSNGVDGLNVEEYAAAFARHRLAMLRGEPVPPETSKLLRGMLQDKEKQLKEKMLEMHTSGLVGSDDKLLRQGEKTMDFRPKPSFDGDSESLRSRSLTPQDISDESDSESKELARMNADDKDSSSIPDDCSTTGSMDDSMEAKRARVENIITNMRTSPTRTPSDNNNIGESRKQKRKQHAPQQHGDTKPSEDAPPNPKFGRLDQDHIKNHLHQMHKNLDMMHQRNGHFSMFDKDSQFNPYLNDVAKRLHGGAENITPSPLERLDLFRRFPMVPYDSNPFDPSNYLKQTNNNNKPLRDQELTKQQTATTEPNNNDLNNLAKVLKAEISNSVGTLVDSIVARFVTNQKKEEKRPAVHQPYRELLREPIVIKPQEDPSKPSSPDLYKTPRSKVTDKVLNPLMENSLKFHADMTRPHHPLFPPPPYFPHMNVPSMQPLYAKEPEQTEALPLIVTTPKKKRTKVTDTRLSPRAARALLQENSHPGMEDKPSPLHHLQHPHPHLPPHPLLEHYQSPLIPVSLPTSVAIPNPSLQHSDVLAMYSNAEPNMFSDMLQQHHMAASRSPPMGDFGSPNTAHLPMGDGMFNMKNDDSFDTQSVDTSSNYDGVQTTTLTPMHLRKAKLMFFYVRYPSSAIIKVYFPDVRFNKNNTAQLVKWFSNFREFFYIQMEKYARQAIAEGVKSAEDIFVTTESEIYRVLNLHYNRNNQIEIPPNFCGVVQSTLREFYMSLVAGKDTEQSWKKAIYKVIARMDDPIPEYFKSPNWMEQLTEL